MILLIGGTSETAPLASGIAAAGYTVLVSTATDAPLEIGAHPRISRRTGSLDEEGLVSLGREKGIRAIVAAAHPYAAAVHAAARAAAERLGLPCLVFRRPAGLCDTAPGKTGPNRILFAADHVSAAALAFADGRPVLLTTGSRNLAPYAAQSRRTGIPLAARVLDAPESLAACRAAGLAEERRIVGRGPFPYEANRAAIERFGIGVVVTKESGRAGGLDAKIAAARDTACLLIIVQRPALPEDGLLFADPDPLIRALQTLLPPAAP